MKSLPAIGAAAIVLSIASFASVSAAEEQSNDQPATRAQVRQAAIDARKAGQLHVGDDPYYPYGRDAAVLKPVRSKEQKERATTASTQDASVSK